MATRQQSEVSNSVVIPTVVITDYSTIEAKNCKGSIKRAKVPSSTLPSQFSQRKKDRTGTSRSVTNTRKDSSEMSSTSSKSVSRKRALATSKTKEDEWADITDPEERRRRQNRIAQRKFREKARDLREQAQRDAQNREHACQTYHIPIAAELSLQTECSGLPWGSFSMPFIIGKGHEAASQQGSGWIMHNHSASPQQATSPEQYLTTSSPFSYGLSPGTYLELSPTTGNDTAVHNESLCFYDQIGGDLIHPPNQMYGHGCQN